MPEKYRKEKDIAKYAQRERRAKKAGVEAYVDVVSVDAPLSGKKRGRPSYSPPHGLSADEYFDIANSLSRSSLRNRPRIFRLLERAAGLGHSCILDVAQFCLTGWPGAVEKDVERYVQLLERAADNDSMEVRSEACYRLATSYQEGEDERLRSDPVEAEYWAREAVITEHPHAVARLASIIHDRGQKASALTLLHRALDSDPGDVLALHYLGIYTFAYPSESQSRSSATAVEYFVRILHLAREMPRIPSDIQYAVEHALRRVPFESFRAGTLAPPPYVYGKDEIICLHCFDADRRCLSCSSVS